MFTNTHTLRNMFFATVAALLIASVSTGCKKDDKEPEPEPEAKPCFVRVTKSGIRDEMPDVLTVSLGNANPDEYYCPSDGKKTLLPCDRETIKFDFLTKKDYSDLTVVYATYDGSEYSCPGWRFGFHSTRIAKEGDSEKFTIAYTSPDGKYTINKTVTIRVVK